MASNLIKLPDTSTLENLIEFVKNLKSAQYTPESWKQLQMVLNNSVEIFNTSDSQEDIDNAIHNLNHALDNLVKQEFTSEDEEVIPDDKEDQTGEDETSSENENKIPPKEESTNNENKLPKTGVNSFAPLGLMSILIGFIIVINKKKKLIAR